MKWVVLRHSYYIRSEDFMTMLTVLHLFSMVLIGFGIMRHSENVDDLQNHLWALTLSAILFVISLASSRRTANYAKYHKFYKCFLPVVLLCSIVTLIGLTAYHGMLSTIALHLTIISFSLTGFPCGFIVLLCLTSISIGLIFQGILLKELYGKYEGFITSDTVKDISTNLSFGGLSNNKILFVDMGLLLMQVVGGIIYYNRSWKLGYLLSRWKNKAAYFMGEFDTLKELEMSVYQLKDFNPSCSEQFTSVDSRNIYTVTSQPIHSTMPPDDSVRNITADVQDLNTGFKPFEVVNSNLYDAPNKMPRASVVPPSAISTMTTFGSTLVGSNYVRSNLASGIFEGEGSFAEEDEDVEWVEFCRENAIANKALGKRTYTDECITPNDESLRYIFDSGQFSHLDAHLERKNTQFTSYMNSTYDRGSNDGFMYINNNMDKINDDNTILDYYKPRSGGFMESFLHKSSEFGSCDAIPLTICGARNFDFLEEFNEQKSKNFHKNYGIGSEKSLEFKGMTNEFVNLNSSMYESYYSLRTGKSDTCVTDIKSNRSNDDSIQSQCSNPQLDVELPKVEYSVETSVHHRLEFQGTPLSSIGWTSNSTPKGMITQGRSSMENDSKDTLQLGYMSSTFSSNEVFSSGSFITGFTGLNRRNIFLENFSTTISNPLLRMFYLLLPTCGKRLMSNFCGIYEQVKGKREVMHKNTWYTPIAIPPRNKMELFSSSIIEGWYVEWMHSFNSYFYSITGPECLLVCFYCIITFGLLTLRQYITLSPEDEKNFMSGYRIFLLIARFIIHPIISILFILTLFRGQFKKNESYTRRFYWLMLTLCIINWIFTCCEMYSLLSLENSGYSVHLALIMELLLTHTSILLCVRGPTFMALYILYFASLLILNLIFSPNLLNRGLFMKIFSQMIIGIGAYCFCYRPLDTNRRLLFCMYVLPYILYLRQIKSDYHKLLRSGADNKSCISKISTIPLLTSI